MNPSPPSPRFRFRFIVLGLMLAAGVVCAEPPAPAAAKTYEVETVRNLTYYEGDDADKVRHKLDVDVPKGAKDFPVVLFVHGGGWIHGDKDFLGVYPKFGQSCPARASLW